MSRAAWIPDVESLRDLDDYAQFMAAGGRSAVTIRLRRWQLRRLSDAVRKPLRNVTTADLLRYITGNTWAPATRYSVRATARDFYAFLESRRRVRVSPAAALPSVKLNRPNLPPAPDEAMAAVVADERVQLMVELAARQGLRRGEIAVIHAGRDLMRDQGGWVLIVHGKGGKDRTIPLHADIAVRLQAMGPGYVFPNPEGVPLSPGRVGELVSRALPEGWTAHSLRRRFATRTFDGSHDLRAVQELLGHASLATTQRYIGTRPESLRSALDAGEAVAVRPARPHLTAAS